MRAGPTPTTILSVGSSTHLRLRTGEQITVRVLRDLGGGAWVVGVRGRVVRAISTLALRAGSELPAVAERVGARLQLRVLDAGATSAGAVGLSPEQAVRAVGFALAHEGVSAPSGRLAELASVIRRWGISPRKAARTLAVLLAKGIDPQSIGIAELLPFLSFEDNNGRRRYRGRRLPSGRREVLAAVKSELRDRRGATPLAVFNALGGPRGTWIAVPFSFRHGRSTLQGTMRLLYVDGAPTRFAMEVQAGARWGFVLDEARRLTVFRDGAADRNDPSLRAALGELSRSLRNKGVHVDDSISGMEHFDGYSAEVMPEGVDLLG